MLKRIILPKSYFWNFEYFGIRISKKNILINKHHILRNHINHLTVTKRKDSQLKKNNFNALNKLIRKKKPTHPP